MLDRHATVRSLAAISSEVRELLRWYGLPDSDISLEQACEAADLDPEDVWAEVEATATGLGDDWDNDDDEGDW